MLDILEKKLTENQTTRKGLTTAEAEKRLSTDGENRLAKKKKTSAAKIFAGQFHDVMVMILLVYERICRGTENIEREKI